MLIINQSGRVKRLKRKTDPTVQEAAEKTARKKSINCWVSLKQLVSFSIRKKNIKLWGLDSDCTVVTFHRVGSFQVKYTDGFNIIITITNNT